MRITTPLLTVTIELTWDEMLDLIAGLAETNKCHALYDELTKIRGGAR